jgi:phosphosulfolactate synthase (CoM biosynthesis protein A)
MKNGHPHNLRVFAEISTRHQDKHMASIHKKGKYWHTIFLDAGGKRFITNTRILHSPLGGTSKEQREKKKQNEAAALIQAVEIEQLARANKQGCNPVENQ